MNTAVLAQSVKRFTRRRMIDATGVACWLAALALLLALFSYHTGDPSLNAATSLPVRNLMGLPGAYAADLLLQTLGLASIFVVLTLACWGWRLLRHGDLGRIWLRSLSLPLLLVSAALLMGTIPAPRFWPVDAGMGGAIGYVLLRLLSALPVWGIVAISLPLVLAALPLAFALHMSEWRGIFRSIARGLSWLGSAPLLLRNLQAGMDYPEADTLAPARKPRKRKPAAAPVSAEPARRATITRSAKKDKEQQARLALAARRGGFSLPSTDLLDPVKQQRRRQLSETALAQNARLLESVLQDFGVKGDIINIRPGPVVTMYELEPAAGTKSSRVIGLADDIARSMSAVSARIAVIPGRNAIGIELPNQQRETVYLRELIEHETYRECKAKLPLVLGKDIGGDPIIADLAKMPHLLVAGTTGSGKSVGINTMLASLIYHLSPEQCKFIMIDPKMLELSVYDDIPHLLTPVVTEPGKAVVALKWTVKEMENRYRLMAGLGVRNIGGYNERILEAKAKGEQLTRMAQTGFDRESGKPIKEEVPIEMSPLPYIVVVVDEMADLMLVAGKDIESSIQRLAQMARAAGIHIIMATQRPSVDVITGVIKANFPTRISFQVTSRIDSRTILGEQGAEQLLGQGDMLYMAGGGRITRVHGPFVSDEEVEKVVDYLKAQGAPEYVEDVTIDPDEEAAFDAMDEDGIDVELYDKAVAIVRRDRKASTSYVQRCLKIGYNRAANLIEKMEREGVVTPANHAGKRDIIG